MSPKRQQSFSVMQKPRPRWMLHSQAVFWRSLMQIGMFLHKLAPPRPPMSHFSKHVKPSTSPLKDGHISLRFWTPHGYSAERKKGKKGKQYPVVVSFHGGGFTIGEAMDDARWAAAVVHQVGAVVIGVDYRRAPEHPFPTAVEDGVDALLWIARHAHRYNLDVDRIAVSGFSCGGNMAFTVPLRLQQEALYEVATAAEAPGLMQQQQGGAEPISEVSTTTTSGEESDDSTSTAEDFESVDRLIAKAATVTATAVQAQKELSIRAIVSFYPSTDYTQSRAQRRATCMRPDQQLSDIFTTLFDQSYLQPPTLDLANPYLSPGRAPPHMLAGLPDDIVLFTCEWDMLLKEGEQLRDRLRDEQNKNVVYHEVPGVPHGWDKAPNPFRAPHGAGEHYAMACKELNRVFGQKGQEEEQ